MAKSKKNKHPLPIQQALAEEIIKIFSREPNWTYNYKQIAHQLEKKEDKEQIRETLSLLARQKIIIESERGKYKLTPEKAYVEGIIDITAGGAAYVMNDNFEDDIYIAPNNVHNALNGDKVRVYLYAKRKNKRLEGEVEGILERARTTFAGTVQVSPRFAFLVPDSNKALVDIFIPMQDLGGVKDGQKAIAEITEWPAGTKNPTGKIIQVLGWPGENDAEMDAILVEYGFPTSFPAVVEQEANGIPLIIPESELKQRRDFRTVTTFTIDPADAKDFDDALSIRKTEKGLWEVGVHIADVSHYVKANTELDKEGFRRATSVYLVDRVIPMLPEKLSNGVCSLRPKEEKLCFSAVFELDEQARIHHQWFGKTVIYSDHRFTYEEAQLVIETGEGPFFEEVLTLDCLAKQLRAERFKSGSIAFEKVEVKFRLDAKGNPLGVYLKENKEANKLIEEFMLLANKKVAEIFGKVKHGETKKSFVYRVHDVPNPDKLGSFSEFAARFGYQVKTGSDREVAHSLNKLMKDVRGKKEQNVLEQLAIRTMSKAIYTTNNIGHYGLAFDHYTHFTSPIRRYPDVMVHRLLEAYLEKKKTGDEKTIEDQCKHCSEMEFQAADAERASVKYKQVQFLEDKKNQIFDGIISGVTEWGIYVEIIENKCEGLVRLRDIDDDFYEFDEKNYCIRGRKGKKYQLGDTVKVRIKNTDLVKKQITFALVTTHPLRGVKEEWGFDV